MLRRRPITINGDKKGEVVNDLIYHTKRNKKKHFHRKSKSWGLSNAVVNDLMDDGVRIIVIEETSNKNYYCVSIDKFFEKSFYLQFDGYELQRFLPEKDWAKTKARDVDILLRAMVAAASFREAS
jgi:hypothetical protein